MSLDNSKIVAEYRRRTPTSAKLAERAKNHFPSGVTHDGRYLQPYPIYVERAAASRKWDADGNEYVDYTGGHGALLLGHNHPDVLQAVQKQLVLGTHFGASQELEIRWAEQVKKLMPSIELLRFTSSGTEATLLAMRLARAFSGKTKVMHFLGHFHGWHDHVAFGVSNHFDGTPTPGVLPEVAQQVVMAPPNDVAETARLLERHKDLAAVIIEPTGASWGQVPVQPEFLLALRELTQRHGVLLIFDEVITGFRCSPGGAQATFGIRPDMTTLAKILAGGMPGGAVGGRRDVMEGLSFTSPGPDQREKVPHQGTFNANPVSAAAGISTLEIVERTDACQRANDYAAHLRDELNRVLRDERVNWAVYGTFSGFHIFTNPDKLSVTPADLNSGKYDHRVLKGGKNAAMLTKLRLGMMIHGVEIFSWIGGPTSAVHTAADLDQTASAFRQTLRMLRDEGEIGG